jgi:hypothetical protein
VAVGVGVGLGLRFVARTDAGLNVGSPLLAPPEVDPKTQASTLPVLAVIGLLVGAVPALLPPPPRRPSSAPSSLAAAGDDAHGYDGISTGHAAVTEPELVS